MKSLDLQTTIRERLKQAAQERFGISLEQIASEVPPRTELGDLAFPAAFELAKRIKQQTGEKRNPRAIAETLRDALSQIEGVAKVEVAGAGYLNVFYDRAEFLAQASDKKLGISKSGLEPRGGRVIVEHTSINPNKAAHLGHLRNAILGDTFVRILRATNENVQVQNYIDNTGVQVADVVVGLLHVEQFTHDAARQKIESLTLDRPVSASSPPPLDYYCWDLYARVGVFYRRGGLSVKEDPQILQLRAEVLHALEEGDNETAQLADFLATKIVECHLNTMERLNIRYDVLPRESEILHLHFWDAAFARLKETGAIRLETEGKHAGCWVMPFESHTGTDEHEADKIIVRSNGTVTYAGKDIAYQLWKLGRLGLDFNYRPFRQYADGHTVWMTATESPKPGNASQILDFGLETRNSKKVYNVIDSRQSYTQEVVKRGVAATAPDVGEAASVHLAYEMVALSPAACEELGLVLSSEERARPYIEMSGRRGLGVKADDLINRLEADAFGEVEARHADLSDAEKLKTAHEIAVGALRYFLLKWTRNSVIAFDFKEALSFEGETGPYCQYAAVRANSIFRKLADNDVKDAMQFIQDKANVEEIKRVFESDTGDQLWSLTTLAARLSETLQIAASTYEPANLAKYAFQLARAFNAFYNDKRNRIIEEKDAARRATLIAIAERARAQLTNALATLGIEVPERM